MGKQIHYIDILDTKIPFHIYIEKRNSVRVSFGKTGINLRMPVFFNAATKQKHFEKAVKWVQKKAKSDPSLMLQYQEKDYSKINTLYIYGKEFQIIINENANRASGKANFLKKENTIQLELPSLTDHMERSKMIKSLLSRICGQLFINDITKRVHHINDKCFKKEIKQVRLKYNKSNWGSCSSNNNINLSTRLLFAPNDVIDYVIIHELAHLYEMNHSPKFWNIVAQVMPSYKEKEQWLKKNGHLCDF